MKVVHIGKYDRTAKDLKILATCRLTADGSVRIDSVDASLGAELRKGIKEPGAMQPVFPRDGLPFLEALRFAYRNPNTLIAGPVVDEQVAA